MAGTREGGLKAAEKNKANDPDYYRKLAIKSQAAWVKNGKAARGFSAATEEQRKEWGKVGGSKSRRSKYNEI